MDINQIQRGELQQRLTAGLKIFGERAPCPVLAPELQATVLLEDLSQQSPFVQPFGRLYSAAAQIPAGGVGTQSKFTLTNPAGSGIVAVLKSIRASTPGVSAILNIGRATATLGAAIGVTSHDSRVPRGAITAASDNSAAGSVLAGFISFERLTQNVCRDCFPTFEPRGPVFSPGEFFGCDLATLNQALEVCFTWEEFNA